MGIESARTLSICVYGNVKSKTHILARVRFLATGSTFAHIDGLLRNA
jgi:hypothetical protein